ncbi:helix-turn-helix domain-containing protein [Dactylosporangium sp. CA-152071]|uniref:helix-turn-helix domain-containing protein n=1 Tax=Dactylosporangium sp. CA-152071 TaxID=3239933 RepID=UPI003D8CF4C3
MQRAPVSTCGGGPPHPIGVPTAWLSAPPITRAAISPFNPSSPQVKPATSTARAQSAQARFAAELRRRRRVAGCSQRLVGKAAYASREWVSKIEAGRRWPGRQFAEAADRLLGAGAELLQLWAEGDAERIADRRQRATIERLGKLQELTDARGDQPIRQMLGSVNERVAAAPDLLLALMNALTRIVVDGVDDGEIVRQVGDLERRALLRESSSETRPALVYLAFDLADAADLLDRARDERLRARLIRLINRLLQSLATSAIRMDEGLDRSTWSTHAIRTLVDGAPYPADGAGPDRDTAPSARTPRCIERPPNRAASPTRNTGNDAPAFTPLGTPVSANRRSRGDNGAGRLQPRTDRGELAGHSGDAPARNIEMQADSCSVAQLALNHRLTEQPHRGTAGYVGAPRGTCRPSRRAPWARCDAQPNGLNGHHRPEPAVQRGCEPRRRTTNGGRVQPACGSAVPRRTLSCLVEICGNECDQGRGAAFETSAGCRSQKAAVAGGTSRDPPTSGRRSRYGNTGQAGCANGLGSLLRRGTGGRRGWLRPPGRAARTVRWR